MSKSLLPTIKMMNTFTTVLTGMERNGIAINLKALDDLEKEYDQKRQELEQSLEQRAQAALGPIPFNLHSPQQLSELIYSRTIHDKKKWAELFGIGTTIRNGVAKKNRPKDMSHGQFVRMVRDHTSLLVKRKTAQCQLCGGKGRLSKRLKDGSESKPRYVCHVCQGKGYEITTLIPAQVAGFRQVPCGTQDVSANGFTTDKEKLVELAESATDAEAKNFFTDLVLFNAISHYLSNFVSGVRRNTRSDSILHTSFVQTRTATGRLSSRDPNYHNQPRGTTFPIRRVVVSRWKGGKILEGDFEQLEYRTAVELAGDENGKEDIRNGVDAHKRTASVLTEAGQPTSRQDAKSRTFKPLYGGTSGTRAEQAYFKWFLEHHSGIADWHDTLLAEALKHKRIVLPSGREYDFPYAKRYPSGGVSYSTQIKNYPVQGFATADIVPITAIELSRQLREHKLRTCLINEIHDSNVLDVHPDEIDIAIKLLRESMLSVPKLLKYWYNYEITVPLAVELKMGDDWLNLKKV